MLLTDQIPTGTDPYIVIILNEVPVILPSFFFFFGVCVHPISISSLVY